MFSKYTSRVCVSVCLSTCALTLEQPGWQLHGGAELGDSGQSRRQPHLGHAGVRRRVRRRGDPAHHRHLQGPVPLRGYVPRTHEPDNEPFTRQSGGVELGKCGGVGRDGEIILQWGFFFFLDDQCRLEMTGSSSRSTSSNICSTVTISRSLFIIPGFKCSHVS